jgi:hypothetical protein
MRRLHVLNYGAPYCSTSVVAKDRKNSAPVLQQQLACSHRAETTGKPQA